MSKKQELIDYLKSNYVPGEINWSSIGKEFGFSPEGARSVWKSYRKKSSTSTTSLGKSSYTEDTKAGVATINKTVNKEVKTLEDLIEACDIDISTWAVVSFECKKWEVGSKVDGKFTKTPMYAVSAKLQKRRVDNDSDLFKEELIKSLKDISPKVVKKSKSVKSGRLLELSVFDLHVGKLAWAPETGEDYDFKVALKRFEDSIEYILGSVDTSGIEKILLPIGNDMLQADTIQGTTTAGTSVDCDVRFAKMVTVLKDALVSNINRLTDIAPVDVVVVPGNHDRQSMLLLGMVLEAYYTNDKNVKVLNSPKLRKYYEYGKCGIMFTHGSEERHADLGMIFATEEPELWGRVKFREAHIGHFHKTKRIDYVNVNEEHGFRVRILSSLSGSDAWHYKKGYHSQKAAEGYLWDKEKGLVANVFYNI